MFRQGDGVSLWKIWCVDTICLTQGTHNKANRHGVQEEGSGQGFLANGDP